MRHCFCCLCPRDNKIYDRSKQHLTIIPRDLDRQIYAVQHIDLSFNRLQFVETRLFRCHRLKSLTLNNNELRQLHPCVAQLVNLERLVLSFNNLTSLPIELGQCGMLRYLDISSNEFIGIDSVVKVPSAVFECTRLRELVMNSCGLTDIGDEIGGLLELQVLSARDNEIRSLSESIGNLFNLVRLDLGSNEIETLPSSFTQLESLEEVWFDSNYLICLPQNLEPLTKLEIFDLSSNKLVDIPYSIGFLKSLVDLSVASNSISQLPCSIGNLSRLQILRIDFNLITTLPETITQLSMLNSFIASGNKLTSLPTSIGSLILLESLHLDYNSLQQLPDTICQCSELALLTVRDNNLCRLPENIGNIRALKVLDLSGNRLQFLPISLSRIYSIKAIWLSKIQRTPMTILTEETHPVHGLILTNYFLPQIPRNVEIFQSSSESTVHSEPAATQYENISDVILALASRSALNRDGCNGECCPMNFKLDCATVQLDPNTHEMVGFKVAQFDDTSPMFGLTESSIYIESLDPESIGLIYGTIHSGDRILSIDDIALDGLNLNQLRNHLSLMTSNEILSVELVIRHDPPVTMFHKFKLKRTSISDSFGIELRFTYFCDCVSALEIAELSANNPSVLQSLQIGDILVEINNESILYSTFDNFNDFIQGGLEAEVVVYRIPSFEQLTSGLSQVSL